jgi:hypothetical protein
MKSSEKIQEIVDKAVPYEEDGKTRWKLPHEYAKDFVALITPYVRKAATKSDWYDVEDSMSEVIFELWRALEMYGPRPFGETFYSYTLKLKTNNILTNRANKRESLKSKINYVSESFDSLLDYEFAKRDVPYEQLQAHHIYDLLTERLEDTKHVKLSEILNFLNSTSKKNKRKIFLYLLSNLTKNSVKDCEDFLNNILNVTPFLMDLKWSLYNNEDEIELKLQEDRIVGYNYDSVSVGDTFKNPMGIVFEIRKALSDGYQIFLFVVGKEFTISREYLAEKCVRCSADGKEEQKKTRVSAVEVEKEEAPVVEQEELQEDTVEKVVEEEVSLPLEERELKLEKTEPVVVTPAKTRKGKERMARTGTAKALIVDLLHKGPQSVDVLAQAVIDAKLTKSTEFEAVKASVSVILSTLMKVTPQMVRVSRGVYQINETVEAAVPATPNPA